MQKKPANPVSAAELRRRAEAQLRKRQRKQPSKVGDRKSAADTQRLLHKLQVHQVELEMQNSELQEARNQMEALLEKYTDLYDFAPVGYFSLDEQGRILEVNLAGAALLGVARARLVKRSLTRFVASASRPLFLSFLEQIFSGTRKRVCEATLLKENGTVFWANFQGMLASAGSKTRKWCRVAVSDITTRKRAEEALQAAHHGLERLVAERTAELQGSSALLASEIKERRRVEEDMAQQLRFETLIADISSKFVNLPPGQVDREIIDAQRRICELLCLDHSAIWQRADKASSGFTLTHFYGAAEGPQPAEGMNSKENFPWVEQQLLAGRIVSVSSLEELPAEAARDREVARQMGIKSNLTIPLSVGGQPLVGALGLNTTRAEREWPRPLVRRLQLVAEIFANALARKRAEETLRVSEARLAAGVDIAGLGFVEVDESTGTVFADDRLRELIGVPPDWEQGMRIVEFWKEHLHPDDVSRVLSERQEALGGKREGLRIEYRYLHPVRGERWIQHIGRPTKRDASGFAVKSFSVLRDITEGKRSEVALRASEETNRVTFEQAAVGIAHVGTDGRWLKVNDRLCAIVGYPREELLKQTFQNITHPEDLEADLGLVRKVLSGELQTYSMEKRYLRKDRSLVWVILTVSLVRTPEGTPLHFISVVEDITERKEAETKLLQQRTELAHIVRVSTMGELAASVAHQLNQPLGAILANAETLEFLLEQDTLALDEARAVVAAIRNDDERASDVIRRMRDLFGKHEMELKPVDLNFLVHEVEQLVSREAALRRISLSVDPAPGLLKVCGDAIHLQQVLLNLIVNGMEAVANEPQERRRVLVRTRSSPEGQAELAVIDTGQGIERDKLARLFEAFYTTKPTGMGMGLSISRTIVQAHGGRIWAENNVSGGATFRVVLPASGQERGGRGASEE